MEDNHYTTYKDFLIREILNNPEQDLSKEKRDILYTIRREKILRPVITLSYTTGSLIAGAKDTYDTIKRYLDEREIDADLIKTGSLGLNSEEPVMGVQMPGKAKLTFSGVFPEKVIDILDAVFNNFVPEENLLGQHHNDLHEPWERLSYVDELPFLANQKRLILNNCGKLNPFSIEEYIAYEGYQNFLKAINNYTPEEVCDIVERSGLRGRGGEGYPTGKKWKNTLNSPAEQRYLICNAGESDPGAFMERIIMESDPHSIIEAVAISSYALGAQKAYIYIESEYEIACERIQKAIDEAKSYGILGHDIFSSGFNLNIQLFRGAGAYVCGEETALIASLEGKRGMPRPKPPYPSKKGLFGQPTTVNNVETLLNIPVIISHGPEWYKQIGTEESSGTKVFSLSGNVDRSGLVEIPMGIPLRDVIYKIGGGLPDSKELKGVLIGGPAGGVMTYEHLDFKVDYESVKSVGGALGSGGIVVMDDDTCIIDTVKYYMNFLQKESCGKCIPCREGIRRMHEILENISQKPQDDDGHSTLQRFKGVMHLEKLANVTRDTSLCGLGQRAANPVLSTLRWYRNEYEEHIFDRKCRAGVCQDLRSFYIDVDKCTGCTICAKKCPTGAILGTPKHPHFIVQEKCIGCGICYESCKFAAIISK
jgi:NADH:ubiquinone oxidoreductase subunit F (NADH-binding)